VYRNVHPLKVVRVGTQAAEIDELLAPVIEAGPRPVP
jgi:hypothetical protein